MPKTAEALFGFACAIINVGNIDARASAPTSARPVKAPPKHPHSPQPNPV
jgi:hypothetical protein